MLHQRVVCFRFKPGTTEEQIQAHMNEFRSLGELMKEILGYQSGRTIPNENNQPPAYDSLHYLTFRNKEDITLYSNHPAHQQFITNHRDIWEDVLSLNAPLEIIEDSPAQEPEPDEY